uniref:Uncharacterized protein n=1 Tax=Tanacetum cinerariifolium TaxID=118510 RepID=A0A699JG30_TANCI|nr:hypothetical protein [Tanacetum cinerariifolium]
MGWIWRLAGGRNLSGNGGGHGGGDGCDDGVGMKVVCRLWWRQKWLESGQNMAEKGGAASESWWGGRRYMCWRNEKRIGVPSI